jgi:PAS domain S-box-containing protein
MHDVPPNPQTPSDIFLAGRAGEDPFRLALQIETVGVLFFNTDGEITEANDAFLRMTGYTREDLHAALVHRDTLTPPEWMPASQHALEELHATGRTTPYEKQYLRKDGTRLSGLFVAKRIAEREGVEFIIDTSAYKRAEHAAQISETQYRTLFESIDQAFCVIEMQFDDAEHAIDYRFLEVNPLFERETGLPNATGAWMRTLRPDHEAHWFEMYGKVALTGEPVHFESRAQALGRWFDVHAFRIGPPELRRVGLLFNDITARRRAEEALRDSQSQLRALIDAAPLGVFLVDGDFRIRQASLAAAPAFRHLGDVVGRDFGEVMHELHHGACARRLVARFRRTLETGERHHEPEFVWDRGPPRGREYYDWQISRIPLTDGRHGVVCYFSDITAGVEARRVIMDADRQKDEFIATLSHELRNPLASIDSAAQLLQTPHLAAETLAWAGQVVQRQSKTMARLLDDLLDVTRLTLGRFNLHRQRVSVASILESALEGTRPLIEASRHRLSITMPPPSLLVEADPFRLGQVVSNLLSNAAKYTDPGGHIALTAEARGDTVVIAVSDNGIGMDAAAIEHVFEMFSQATGAEQRAQGGLGIGLALVRGIVNLHGGWVKATSPGSGGGSTFEVGLPRLAGEERTSELQRAAVQGVADAKYRILVADDNADAGETLALLLELYGHEVRVATTGTQALHIAERYRPHAAVLDIGMPELNGYDVARRIRAAPWGAEMSLIAATGWGQEKDKREAREAGFDVHLTKPVDAKNLMALIARQVGQRER